MFFSHTPLVTTALATAGLVAVVACSSDQPASDETSSMTASMTASVAGGMTSATTTGSATTGSPATTSSATLSTTAGTSTTTSTTTASASATTTTTTGGGSGDSGGAGGSAGMSSIAGGASSVGGAGGASTSGGGAGGGTAVDFALTSPVIATEAGCALDTPDACPLFETEQSYFQDNLSPELAWTQGPMGTQSYALVFHDLTTEGAHWAIWNLSAATLSLPAALPTDATLTSPVSAQQVNASWANTAGDGYAGPGSCSNVYEFTLYALDTASFTPQNASNPDAVQDELEASSNLLGKAFLRARANPEDGNNC